jgi:hypothetical protein
MTADHGCARAVEWEAIAHLDLLPQDDEVIEPSAEESAVSSYGLPVTLAQSLD